jgi:hypothetical protein
LSNGAEGRERLHGGLSPVGGGTEECCDCDRFAGKVRRTV